MQPSLANALILSMDMTLAMMFANKFEICKYSVIGLVTSFFIMVSHGSVLRQVLGFVFGTLIFMVINNFRHTLIFGLTAVVYVLALFKHLSTLPNANDAM